MLNRNKPFALLSLLTILIATVVAAFGLFDCSMGHVSGITNQYGDIIDIYGRGLYKDDSLFRAPIFRGTDATILFFVCPLSLYIWIRYTKRDTIALYISLLSIIGVIGYYAVSISFGVKYNYLHLAYIALFGCSIYAFILGMVSTSFDRFKNNTLQLPFKGIYFFLTLTGLALIVAWLPDIITSLIKGRSLLMIEHYTTEITYVLDIGLIAPACFVCIYLLIQRHPQGFVLLDVLLTLCLVIGVMLPIQTFFQEAMGIRLPLPVIITKIASFTILAVFAGYFKLRLLRAFKTVK